MKAAPKVNVKTRATALLARIIFGYLVCAATFSFAQGEWTAKSDMPTARFGLSAEAVNGKIYAIGGSNASSILGMVEEYDPATDTWSTKTDMPTIRKGMATSVVNGRIYVFGGSSSLVANASLATVEEYDPATDRWTAKAAMNFPSHFLSASNSGGRLYAIGGSSEATKAVRVYDPELDTWMDDDTGALPDTDRYRLSRTQPACHTDFVTGSALQHWFSGQYSLNWICLRPL